MINTRGLDDDAAATTTITDDAGGACQQACDVLTSSKSWCEQLSVDIQQHHRVGMVNSVQYRLGTNHHGNVIRTGSPRNHIIAFE